MIDYNEDDYMPEFDGEQVVMQLGRIMDSATNPIPRDWVKTDDGDIIKGISPAVAQKLRDSILNVPAPRRLEVIRYVQSTLGFKEAVKAVS